MNTTPLPTIPSDITRALSEIVKGTDNDVIIAMVVIAIVIIALAIPFTILMNKRGRDKLAQYIQRDKMILDAFGKNAEAMEGMTSVLSGLKSTLDTSNSNCSKCRNEQMRKFDQLLVGQGEINAKLAVLADRKGDQYEHN